MAGSIPARPLRLYPGRFPMGALVATLNRTKQINTHEGALAARIDAPAQLERSVMSCLLWDRQE